MAGLRPGFGRGGITHSFEVIEPGVPGPGEETGTTAGGLQAKAGARGGGGATAEVAGAGAVGDIA